MTALRLRGMVGGVERSFPIGKAKATIGSLGDNEVVLPVRGVSRQHAAIHVTGDELTVEDLDSKNGVKVNGQRVRTARLRPGDDLTLGPVTLSLEAVATEEAALAIDFGPPPEAQGEDLTTATAELVPSRTAGWVALLRDVVERAAHDSRVAQANALEAIVQGLPVATAVLLEWTSPTDVLVVSARGSLADRSVEEAGRRLITRAGQGAEGTGTVGTFIERDPHLACAVACGQGKRRFGLLLVGDYPGRDESAALLELLIRALSPLPASSRAPREPSSEGLVFPEGYIAGGSAAMRALYAEMASLGRGDLPVLLLGETGVGKELVARTLHLSSERRAGAFVAVNCAAIPSEMLEAELFGIGKGVATGVSERPGRFRLADGGTLFLDEIGEMPTELQAKLLRALQEKEIQPVGGAPVAVDLRVVTATNIELEQRIEDGRFRRDLYYRIAGCTLTVPPLRERREDILPLVEFMLNTSAEQTGRHVRGLTVDAARRLTEYPWPGNVRELQHEVRRMVYRCRNGAAIDSTMLSPAVLAGPVRAATDAPVADGDSLDLESAVSRLEQHLIGEALRRARGNRSEAARLLGISRNGLAMKMKRLGLADDEASS